MGSGVARRAVVFRGSGVDALGSGDWDAGGRQDSLCQRSVRIGRAEGCEDRVLEGEGGFGPALPEAGEQHDKEAELGEQERGPDPRLREHVHRDCVR